MNEDRVAFFFVFQVFVEKNTSASEIEAERLLTN